MRNFILGIVITIVALLIGGLGLALLGFLPTRANSTPPAMESHIAMSALDNSVDRHAPRLNNPVPPTDENLIDGMKSYTMNCAGCHGGLDRKPADFGHSFYPPAPDLILDPPDDPEWHVFYVVRNGVRYTGMPAWDKTLSEPDMWKITAFLTRIDKLPPAVQDYWKKSTGAAPPAAATGEEQGHHDHK
jgi:thiosulfate dehydrogenase